MFKNVFSTLLVGSFALASSSFAGREAGNGGDGYAMEVVAIAHYVYDELSKDKESVPEVDFKLFQKRLGTTRVTSQDRLFLNGVEVDFINYPNGNRIEMSRKRWEKWPREDKVKIALVFHEFLGVMGVDDSNYRVSRKYLDRLISGPWARRESDYAPQVARNAVRAMLSLYNAPPAVLYGGAKNLPDDKLEVLIDTHFQDHKDSYRVIVRGSDSRVLSVELLAENLPLDR